MASISVVIPVWNDAEMLANCLRALSAPDPPGRRGHRRRQRQHRRLRRGGAGRGGRGVISEPLRGILQATVAGFDAATGEVIARLDADSVPPADWLERIEATLAAAPPPAAVTGPGDFYDAGALAARLGRRALHRRVLLVDDGMARPSAALRLEHGDPGRDLGRMRYRVDTTLSAVHDDLYLSFRVEPDTTVIFDPTLRVGISARPFRTWRGLGRRLGWAWRTLWLNSKNPSPRQRRAIRRQWISRQSSRTGSAGHG